MLTRSKLLLVGLAATVCMVFAVGAASAGRLSTSSRTFRLTWSALTMEDEFGLFTSTCKLTLEGSFHSSTISKVASAAIGYVSRGTGGSCTGEAALLEVTLEALPWALTYERFSGTLPNITAIELGHKVERIRVRIQEVFCLYQPIAAGAFRLSIGAGGVVSGVQPPATWTRIAGTDPPCPPTWSIFGTARATVLGTTTSFSVRLI